MPAPHSASVRSLGHNPELWSSPNQPPDRGIVRDPSDGRLLFVIFILGSHLPSVTFTSIRRFAVSSDETSQFMHFDGKHICKGREGVERPESNKTIQRLTESIAVAEVCTANVGQEKSRRFFWLTKNNQEVLLSARLFFRTTLFISFRGMHERR
jgi:hypothetical protein